jgi:hypothetical protein
MKYAIACIALSPFLNMFAAERPKNPTSLMLRLTNYAGPIKVTYLPPVNPTFTYWQNLTEAVTEVYPNHTLELPVRIIPPSAPHIVVTDLATGHSLVAPLKRDQAHQTIDVKKCFQLSTRNPESQKEEIIASTKIWPR